LRLRDFLKSIFCLLCFKMLSRLIFIKKFLILI
jgi:hypothetical protein